jgi:hypothetical protein
VNFDLSPRIAAAHVDLARPVGVYLLFQEIGGDAKGRASTSLALRAMTAPTNVGSPLASARSEPQQQCAILIIVKPPFSLCRKPITRFGERVGSSMRCGVPSTQCAVASRARVDCESKMKQIRVDDQLSMFMCSGVQQKPRSGVIGPQKQTIADETLH